MRRLVLCMAVVLLGNIIGCGSSKEEAIAVYESEVKELERLAKAAVYVETSAELEIQEVKNTADELEKELLEVVKANLSHQPLASEEERSQHEAEGLRLSDECDDLQTTDLGNSTEDEYGIGGTPSPN